MACRFDIVDDKYRIGTTENISMRKLQDTLETAVRVDSNVRPYADTNKFKILDKSKEKLRATKQIVREINIKYNPTLKKENDFVRVVNDRVVEIDVVESPLHNSYILRDKVDNQVDNTEELEELESASVNTQGIFYNMGDDLDKEVLDESLSKYLKNFMIDNGIKRETIEEAEKRMGIEVAGIAMVDFVSMTIAVNDNHLPSLTEEVLHIIIEDQWEHSSIQDLVTSQEFFDSTEYTSYYEEFENLYRDDFKNDPAGLRIKVHKEILAKIMKRGFMLLTNKKMRRADLKFGELFYKRVVRSLKKLFSIFGMKFKNMDRHDYNKVKEELTEALGAKTIEIFQNLSRGTAKVDVEAIKAKYAKDAVKNPGKARVQRNKKVVTEMNKIKDVVLVLKKSLIDIENKQVGIIHAIFKDPKKYKRIVDKYGDNIEADQLRTRRDFLIKKRNLNILDKEELRLLIDLIAHDRLDEVNNSKLQANKRRVKRIEKTIEENSFEGGLLALVLGKPERVPGAQGVAFREGLSGDYETIKNLIERHRDESDSFRITPEDYNEITEFMLTYKETLINLNRAAKNWNFTTLAPSTVKTLKNELDTMVKNADDISNFLTDITPELTKQIYDDLLIKFPDLAKNNDSIAPEDLGRILHEMSNFQFQIFSRQTGKELIYKKLVLLIEEIHIKTQMDSIAENKDLLHSIKDDLAEIENMFGSVIGTFKLFTERDDAGNKTNYFTAPTKTKEWTDKRDEEFEKARIKASEFSNQEFREVTINYADGSSKTKIMPYEEFDRKHKKAYHSKSKFAKANAKQISDMWNSGLQVHDGKRKLNIPDNDQKRKQMFSKG